MSEPTSEHGAAGPSDEERLRKMAAALEAGQGEEPQAPPAWEATPARDNGHAASGPETTPSARPLRGSVHERAVANPERGQVEIVLGGVLFIMTPTPAASRQIEAAVPWSLGRMFEYARKGDLKFEELAVVVTEGLAATGDRGATLEKVTDLIWREGVAQVIGPVTLYLYNSLTGGRSPAKKNTIDSSTSPTGNGSAWP